MTLYIFSDTYTCTQSNKDGRKSVNFPFLDGDVPRSTSCGVYISRLICFARASSYVTDCNIRNKLLTQKLLKQVVTALWSLSKTHLS